MLLFRNIGFICNKLYFPYYFNVKNFSCIAMTQKVWVKMIPGDERLKISLTYCPVGGKINVYNFDRLQNEDVQKTLDRISANISKDLQKKSKKANSKDKNKEKLNQKLNSNVAVALFNNGLPVDISLLNSEVWKTGINLQIGDDSYTVIVNSPTINCIELPQDSIMAEFFVYPRVVTEFADIKASKFKWMRAKCSQINEIQLETALEESKSNEHNNVRENSQYVWEEIHRGLSYIPKISDIGYKLRVSCTPCNKDNEEGVEKDAISCEVSAGPGFCPFESRHMWTKQLAGDTRFRVISYNLLADTYADSDYSRTFLYPYCPPYALNINYRKQLFIKEIIGYNADIICLQEVDRKIFLNDLEPVLNIEGFNGSLKLKAGQTPEGTATFYRSSKFKLVGQHDLDLVAAFQQDEMFKDLLEKISNCESFFTKFMERTTTFQVTVLESTETHANRVMVLTTHLYFHPRCPHIRLLQMIVCLRYLQNISAEYTVGNKQPSLIICGDLNSTPDFGVNTLLTEGNITTAAADWFAGGKEEYFGGIDFSHQFQFKSACGYPRYTNYVSSFAGCLDYIYIESDKLDVAEVIPMVSHEEVMQYTALPNVVFPSDHLAIVCDLQWKTTVVLQ